MLFQLTATQLPEQILISLTWISKLGCIVSIISLVVMISIFVLIESRDLMTLIHANLAVALILLCVTFLCIEMAHGNPVSCVMESIFLYYFSMATLVWMLVEGIYLYLQVVVVFVVEERVRKPSNICMFGWLTPLFILITQEANFHILS